MLWFAGDQTSLRKLQTRGWASHLQMMGGRVQQLGIKVEEGRLGNSAHS